MYLKKGSHITIRKTTKAVVALALLLALTITSFGFDVTQSKAATSGTFGESGELTWTLDGGVLTISGKGEIPDYVYVYGDDTRPWGSSYDLTKIIISEGITRVGDNAFRIYDFTSIERTIVLPETLESIGNFSFFDMRGLKNVTIPSSVKSIGEYAFCDCCYMKSIEFHDGLESIGEWAFQRNRVLTQIDIPNSVNSIGEGAFSGCSALKSVKLPDKLKILEGYIFCSCTDLESITLPDSLESIGRRCFYGTALSSVIIPKSVKSISQSAFYCWPNTNPSEYKLKKVTFQGESPIVGADLLDGEEPNIFGTADASLTVNYPATDQSWTAEKRAQVGGTVAWVPDLTYANTELATDTLFYDGTAKKPLVSLNGLTEGVDYQLTYSDNVNAGIASVLIQPKDLSGKLVGKQNKQFIISKAKYDMSGITFPSKTAAYTGLAQSLAVSGTLPQGVSVEYINNGKIDVGSYVVTARFSTDNKNYEVPEDMTATMTITKPNSNTDKSNNTAGTNIVKKVINKITYQVDTENPTKGATVLSLGAKSVTKCSIPDMVKINGTYYPVKTIAAGAGKNYKKLKKLTIGRNINSIGKQAFSGCNKLKNIEIKSKKLSLSNVGSNAFNGLSKKANVKVQQSKIKSYVKILKARR